LVCGIGSGLTKTGGAAVGTAIFSRLGGGAPSASSAVRFLERDDVDFFGAAPFLEAAAAFFDPPEAEADAEGPAFFG